MKMTLTNRLNNRNRRQKEGSIEMTRNEAKSKEVDEKLVEAYAVKAILTAIDVINKIPDDGCPYPELASEGYSLAVEKLREMIKPYLQDDDLGL